MKKTGFILLLTSLICILTSCGGHKEKYEFTQKLKAAHGGNWNIVEYKTKRGGYAIPPL